MNNRLEKYTREDEKISETIKIPEQGNNYEQEESPGAIINGAERLLRDFDSEIEIPNGIEPDNIGNFREVMRGFVERAKKQFCHFIMAMVIAGSINIAPNSARAGFFEGPAINNSSQKQKENKEKNNESVVDYLKKKYDTTSKFFHEVNLSIEMAKIFLKMEYYANFRENGKMSKEEIEFRERIAQNVTEVSYSVFSLLDRTEDYVKNEKPYSKEEMKKADLWSQIRTDMFRKYLGLKPFGNFLKISPEKPEKSKDKYAIYYSFDKTKMFQSIKQNWNKEVSGDIHNFDNFVKEAMPGISNQHFGNVINTDYLTQLGTFKMEVGYDEKRKERYISYYDKWDLDPPFTKLSF